MSQTAPDGEHQEALPQRREPVFNIPAVVLLLIASFVAVHLVREYVLTFAQDITQLRTFAFIPGRLTYALSPETITSALTGAGNTAAELRAAEFFLGDGSLQPWTLLTYSFLHGDYAHLGVNCLWLAAFGVPVARRFGAVRFLALFAITAIAGALAHFALHSTDFIPVVGASAGVSGAMAAAIRFVFQPGAPLGPRIGPYALPPDVSARLPALPLADTLKDRRVLQFTLIWFGINLFFGLFSVQLGLTGAPVAWEAHAGGFLAGFFLFRYFDPPAPDLPDLYFMHR